MVGFPFFIFVASQVTFPCNGDFILKDQRSVCVCAPWKGDTENIAFCVLK